MYQKSELRKHYYLDEVVLIAPKRSRRPQFYKKDSKLVEHHALTCVFCHNTEKILYAVNDTNGWRIKVVPNINEAVSLDNPHAYGSQEVIIETPDHNKPFSDLDVLTIKQILHTYQQRTRALKSIPHIKYVQVFKNFGPAAAASVPHEHSQIYALPIVPPAIKKEAKALEEYRKKHQNCAICDVLNTERHEQKRVVYESEYFVSLTPYASKAPLELWIVTNKHINHFSQLTDSSLYDLACHLKSATAYLKESDIDYNFYVHETIGADSHTMIQIIPRPNIWAGLELGTGICINPVMPETAAEQYAKYFKVNVAAKPLFANLK